MAQTLIRSSRRDPNAFGNFPRKFKISAKMFPFWFPFSVTLGTCFEPFAPKWPKGSRAAPQSVKSARKWSPRVPKWSPRVPKCPPEVFKSTKKTPKCTQGWQTGGPRYHNGAPRSPKVLQRRHKPFKVPLQHQNVPQGAKKQASTHRQKQPTNQISKEGQK